MQYKVRKGLESPCMIRGLLSTDYWIFVAACAAFLTLNLLSVRSAFLAGTWNGTLLMTAASVLSLLFLRIHLKRKAARKKFKGKEAPSTISNFPISRILLKRK